MAMIRATVPAQMAALGEGEVEVVISTAALARDGHILEPTGCDLTNYRANPVVLWQHNPDQPVGRATELVVEGDRIRARITFAPAGISAKADEIRGLVKTGIVSGISVGFDVQDGTPLDPKKPRGGQRFTKWELLECSFCSVPVDPGAAVTTRAETLETLPMDEPLTRAGKMLSAANQQRLDDAAGHLDRAFERHKAVGDHLDALKQQTDGADEEATDQHEDAADAHRALGRCLRAVKRCLRAVVDNANAKSDAAAQQTEPDDDDSQQRSQSGPEDADTAAADQRRRHLDLMALSRA